jgi:hypothetical protein
VVEHLPSKCEALISNPSTNKKSIPKQKQARHQWLTSVILDTEAEKKGEIS